MELAKFTNNFSEEIYESTYKFENETISDTIIRIATAAANVEENPTYWKEKFIDLLSNFKFLPGGRIISNIGTTHKGTTLLNCFVSGFQGHDRDSMEGIMAELRRQALILKSEGGYGINVDVLRPRGGYINGIGVESPGAVKMLDMWDTQSEVITSGSGRISNKKNAKGRIRKGAQISTMSCWHPDIVEFITAKQTPGRLTKFNMSVLITDDFMQCILNHKPWNLEYPDYDNYKIQYKEEWDGNLAEWKNKGYGTIIYKSFKDANELWDIIMKSTYNRNEPGVLFVDTINKLNNISYNEYINTTNPCGEIPMGAQGVCLLGSINLTQFVDGNTFDFIKLEKYIPIAIRFLDNINDITNTPLPEQKEQIKLKRRIGLGITGYASALYMMKETYGSISANSKTELLMKCIANIGYKTSALLAQEKGSFPLYDADKFLQSNYVQQALNSETIEYIRQHGMRNSHLFAIAPTGTISILANCVSGGLEPVFSKSYIRTIIVPTLPTNIEGTTINWTQRISSNPDWIWSKEGDEDILYRIVDGTKYKIDKVRGYLKEVLIQDYGIYWLSNSGITNIDKEKYIVTATDLSIDSHVTTMEIFAKYIDQSISKTINLPNDFSYEQFKDVYYKLYNTGVIKGGTTYRAGTMASVLSDATTSNNANVTNNNPIANKRPKELPCDIHQFSVQKEDWIVLVGVKDNTPYEIFAFKKNGLSIPKRYNTGTLRKIKSGVYSLLTDDGFELDNIRNYFVVPEEEALTRMISTALRYGTPINFIYEQLLKSEGTIMSFSKAIARTLKKYVNGIPTDSTCPSCNAENVLNYQEGCIVCSSCGYSACN